LHRNIFKWFSNEVRRPAHPKYQIASVNGVKVNGIANEVDPGDHGGFDLDHSPVVGEAISAIVESDEGRQGYMANDTILFLCPIPRDIGC
jgi:hypothetical protein